MEANDCKSNCVGIGPSGVSEGDWKILVAEPSSELCHNGASLKSPITLDMARVVTSSWQAESQNKQVTVVIEQNSNDSTAERRLL